MPSPFPGMDPYLEGSGLWPDVHTCLLPELRGAIVACLPERYTALIGQHVWLEGPDEGDRLLLGSPDIQFADPAARRGGGVGEFVGTAPVVTTLPAVRRTGHRYLRITDRDRRRLVTVIELLSPSNKDSGKNRPQYLEKRNEYLATGVNLVEIDLLRAGERMPQGDPPPGPNDYLFLVARADRFPTAELWPFSVRDPIPRLTVPLDPADPDVTIDPRPCLDRVYDLARYDRLIDYTRPTRPPLAAADAAWAAGVVAARTGGA